MRLTAPLALTAMLAGASSTVSAQTTYGTYEQPLEGRRYETMRALANYVDDTAHDAYDSAREDARHGSRTARTLLPALRSFATAAADFHDRMDNYDASTADVPDDVDSLILRARRIEARLRSARGVGSTAQAWPDVMDGLDRMKRAAAGQDVEVPDRDSGSADYDRDYGPYGNRPTRPVVGGGLTGPQLEEFHQLSHQFADAVSRTYEIAWRQQKNFPGTETLVTDLRNLTQGAYDLHQRADINAVDPREVKPMVERLLAQARHVDETMRAQRVFNQAQDQWNRAIEVANQMAALVR
ncbi:MAG TPA: hypothetical protein VFT38_14960 [Vicinamibacteria bacterium]|nr:hypothetical protein [Vicinamibacteria bacterium]